jgi:hypothetical protein
MCHGIHYVAHMHAGEGDMPKKKLTARRPARHLAEAAQAPLAGVTPARAPWADTVVRALTAEAERDGLLAGEKSQHVTFRAPPALVEAAKANLGIESTSELGMLALMMLAQPDPMAEFMKRTRGALGKDHTLEC